MTTLHRPRIACHVQTWGAVRLRAAGAGSISDLHFTSEAPFRRALSDIRLLGFEGVEVFDGDLVAWESQGLSVGDMGLTLSAVYCGAYLIYDDIWPEERARIDRVCALASEHGCENVVLGVGGVRASGVDSDDLHRIADRVTELAAVAESHGATGHYHPHPSPGGHTPADIDRILGRTSVKLCPDLAVLSAGGVDPLDFVRRHVGRIEYAHFKDSREGIDTEVGFGDIAISEIVRTLLAERNASWFVTELDASHTDPSTSARAMLGKLRSFMADADGPASDTVSP